MDLKQSVSGVWAGIGEYILFYSFYLNVAYILC